MLCVSLFFFFCILVSLFFAKYNAAEGISYKPNIQKYKHTNKRYSVAHCLIWSTQQSWQLYVIYMETFLGFSRSFLKLLRCKIIKCWLKEIKRHFFFRQILFLKLWYVGLCLGFQERKISLIFPNNAYKFAYNFIHLDVKKILSYTLI